IAASFDCFRSVSRLLRRLSTAVRLGALLDQRQVFFGADVGEGAEGFADGGAVGSEPDNRLVRGELIAFFGDDGSGDSAADGSAEFLDIAGRVANARQQRAGSDFTPLRQQDD